MFEGDPSMCSFEINISGDRHLCWARAFSGYDDFGDVVGFAEKMARKFSEWGRVGSKALADVIGLAVSVDERSFISSQFTLRTLQCKAAEMTT
jgi:hypothetical protein